LPLAAPPQHPLFVAGVSGLAAALEKHPHPPKPGKEILHPVAVTIFGGLVSATPLDALITPALFLIFGEKP